MAIVGLGTLENSVFVERGVLRADALAALRESGAVGEMCGRFFDAEGDECDSPWRDRVVGVQVEQLRKIPQVIGVVSGSDRSAAIIAAVRGGLLKSLIIDEAAAITLIGGPRTRRREISKTRKSKNETRLPGADRANLRDFVRDRPSRVALRENQSLLSEEKSGKT